MRGNRVLFRDDHYDAPTVQVSDANSHLGHLLLEADWDELSNHLATPEGRRDAGADNDPLGLFSRPGAKNVRSRIPSDKNAALFAALFVRAPFEVIEEIFATAPSSVDHPRDLAYALSVVPSEEEARSRELRENVPFRARTWTGEEYARILHLLLRSFASSRSPPSSLLDFWPPWVVGASDILLTPLAVAAYNPDVPAAIVRILCVLEPRAMDKECKFIGAAPVRTVPLIVAAASPLPPESSSAYDDANHQRWEKVKSLALPKAWYAEQLDSLYSGETNDIGHPLSTLPPPEPTLHQIQIACEESMRRNEWELVREFLKRYHSGESRTEGTVDKETSGLEQVRSALERHDGDSRSATHRWQHAQEKARAREEWLRKNMGLVMYPIDVAMDLASSIIPSSRKKRFEAGSRIVSPMS